MAAPKTTNLELPLGTLGDFEFKQSFKGALQSLDSTLGALGDVEVLDAAGGDPVEGALSAKLAAMEARLVALETA